MGTITGTLIKGLTKKMVDARLTGIDASSFLFGTYFPVKRVQTFSWKTLTNQLQQKNTAADIHADNSTIARKRRPVFQSASGDFPYIAISRELERKDLKEYKVARALAQYGGGGADAIDLVDYWGNDVDFCFNGVQAELEYIAWALVSNAGSLSFTTTNNATFANEFDLDYAVDDTFKVKNSTSWGNASSADIIGDLRTWIKLGKDNNINIKHAFVNLDELYKICNSEQIIKACASYISNLTGTSQTPTLEQVNQMLARQPWLNGLTLHVIDQTITREVPGQTPTSDNPFADARIVLSETAQLGTTQYDILDEDTSAKSVITSIRSHTVIKKYGEIEPEKEVTIGEADALPVLDTAYRNIYARTDATEW